MSDVHTVRAIAWQRVFPSLRLVGALRIALSFKALVLAAIAISGTVAGWRALGNIVRKDSLDPVLAAQVESLGTWPWEHAIAPGALEGLTEPSSWTSHSPLVYAWSELSSPFRLMFEAPSLENFVYALCCALWSLVVWSFFGGAITRLAAVAFARHENASLGQLAAFVSPRMGAYFVAPLFPLLGTFLLAALLAVLGLVMRLEVGVLLASIVWPVVLLFAFMMTFLLAGMFFGFPLMWGAISTEGTDAFGALSHSYSYVYQRPLQFLGYALLAAVLGVPGWYLVSWFAAWILQLSQWSVAWGAGAEQVNAIYGAAPLGRIGDRGAAIIGFWENCVRALAFGFLFSYFWSATTVIYFLLRRLVDATEMDEVFMTDERDQHGLPPLKTGPDGMPMVVDEPVAAGEDA